MKDLERSIETSSIAILHELGAELSPRNIGLINRKLKAAYDTGFIDRGLSDRQKHINMEKWKMLSVFTRDAIQTAGMRPLAFKGEVNLKFKKQ